MIRAFVLGIVGSRSELVSSLRSIRSSPHVDEAYLIWGTYDVIAKVTVPGLEDQRPGGPGFESRRARSSSVIGGESRRLNIRG
jgi:hypothetical protein